MKNQRMKIKSKIELRPISQNIRKNKQSRDLKLPEFFPDASYKTDFQKTNSALFLPQS